MTKQKKEKILKQVQNDKNVETGRSMTEMLGVLAIIGVLSIGGIAGYTYAMERHHTNEILNAASQRAIVIASQIAAGRQVSLTEFEGQKEVAGGTFDGTFQEWDDEFGITVTGVKESVCQKLLKATEGTDVVLAKLDGSDFVEADCAGGSFLITYSNDLGKGGDKDKYPVDGEPCSNEGEEGCHPWDGNMVCENGHWVNVGAPDCSGTECTHDECDNTGRLCLNGIWSPEPDSTCVKSSNGSFYNSNTTIECDGSFYDRYEVWDCSHALALILEELAKNIDFDSMTRDDSIREGDPCSPDGIGACGEHIGDGVCYKGVWHNFRTPSCF